MLEDIKNGVIKELSMLNTFYDNLLVVDKDNNAIAMYVREDEDEPYKFARGLF